MGRRKHSSRRLSLTLKTIASIFFPASNGFARAIRDESWQAYQHEYGSAGGTELSIDTGTDLMRLATGGSAE